MDRKHSFFSLDLMNRVTTGLIVVVTLRVTKPHHAERDDYIPYCQSNKPGRRRPVSRSGVILAAALVALFVVSLLGLALVQLVLIHHRQEQVEAQRQQCFWLAESGVQRRWHGPPNPPITRERLGTSLPRPLVACHWRLVRQYRFCTGSKLLVAPARAGATVTIEVKAAQPGDGRKIHVEAHFPDDPVRRIVCEREILINRSR